MDVDIDVQPAALQAGLHKVFPNIVKASQVDEKRGILVPHNVGYYFQDVPIDPQTGLAAAPYQLAQELGCFKMDFLPLHALNRFESREDMLALLEVEPDWDLLLIPSVVQNLFQLSKHAELLSKLRPRSLLELADALALPRPKKAYMVPYYLTDKVQCRKLLYAREEGDHTSFKKAHAIAYAMIVVLQLHLSKAGIPLT
jgi:DNA polymerase III alpha subunit